MDEKMSEILKDLNEFHNNILNLNKINDSFKNFIETIEKEKNSIEANKKDAIKQIEFYQENLDGKIESIQKSIVSFIKDENQSIDNTYNSFLEKMEEDKKYLDDCCTRYLNSIKEQDALLKENQELIKKELLKLIEDMQLFVAQELDKVNNKLVEVNNNYNKMIQMFSEMDILNEFKKNRKTNKIMFALLSIVIVAIIALMIAIILI